MKFYYDGKLMRTSKTNHYTHAVVREDDKLISCHGTKELAEKARAALISKKETEIASLTHRIDRINKGYTYHDVKYGRGKILRVRISPKDIPEILNAIEMDKQTVAKYKAYKVVELEER